MPKIDPTQVLTIFIGNMPTFIAVILAWMHSNARFSDMNSRFSDLYGPFSDLNTKFSDVNTKIAELRTDMNLQDQQTRDLLSDKIDNTRDLLRAEFRRVKRSWTYG